MLCMMVRRCYLKCILNSHAPIELPHNVEIVVGRSKTTKIKNQSCSRQQISLKADCDNCQVHVKHLGANPSGLDGFAMNKNGAYTLSHGSRIEILLNSYIHTVEFCPPPAEAENYKKRKIEEEADSKNNHKALEIMHHKLDDSLLQQVNDIWEDIDKGELYIFTAKNVRPSKKIAAFDMDGTLIKTKSGKVYPVDTNDWQLAFPNVGKKLNELIMDGFKVVVLSNQAPIGNGRVKIEDFKKKIEALVTKLNIPVQVFIATGKGFYRKPAIGMWKILSEQKNGDVEIDVPSSFFCGDAAGRLANWAPGKKKDHSMADKLLAENLSLKFYTPEEYFLGHSMSRVPVAKPEFVPKEVKPENFNENLIADETEILVLVGYPGSGKSFLAKQIEEKSNKKYVTVCRDVLGSWQKCASEATKLIKNGKSVTVDSTNPDVASRSRWVNLAKELNVNCRCVKMLTGKAHSQHNNKFRELMKVNHMVVNDIVFHTYKNKFAEPSTAEGFGEVISVNFNPCFDNEDSEKLYKMYLLEKV